MANVAILFSFEGQTMRIGKTPHKVPHDWYPGFARLGALVFVAAALGLALASASPSEADTVPGRGPANIYHFSTDLTPIRVILVNDVIGKADLPDLVAPRAYVVFSADGPTSDKGPLPAEFSSDHIELMFVDRSGEPWSIAVSQRAKLDGISLKEAAARMRNVETAMEIYSSKNPRAMADLSDRARSRTTPQTENVEGLTLHRDSISDSEYYFGEASDTFFSVHCPGRPNSRYRCTFDTNVTDGVIAQVKLADFRVHGGRAWANNRIRFSRELACRFLTRC
jgi:hypothetical protein